MLKIDNLIKQYDKFLLNNVSFYLEKGYIMGFIGENGAGKSTTMKCILNLAKADSGSIKFFNQDLQADELAIKQDIGFMLEPFDYYRNKKISKVVGVYKTFFSNWSDEVYYSYLRKFNIDENKKIKELSAGMKVKLSLALALSHNAKLFILDEPTSGLDPIARDELLDIFRDVIADGERSILFSTHITSDLDKCADFILYIHNGKIILNDTKDSIILTHSLIKGSKAQLTDDLQKKLVGYKLSSMGFIGLIKNQFLQDNCDMILETPNLEDILIFYNRRNENDFKKVD